ncbi:MAG: hypothetical protein ACO1N7_11625 [Sphingobacteriaceae bacterium]
MIKIRKHKFLIIALCSFLLVFLVLPNIFNSRERAAFSNEYRLEQARVKYHIKSISDSVELIPGQFYKRGAFIQTLLGTAYRDLWQQKIKVPVLRLQKAQGRLTPISFSGSMQTIGIKVKDTAGSIWSIRSVNKDQIGALPKLLHPTILRPMFRDQACSLNPYGSLPLIKLAPAIRIHCDTPQLYFFPYDPSFGKYNSRMAGRLVMLSKARENNAPGSSIGTGSVLSSEQMMELLRTARGSVDTLLYLRTRLFDMLISDWDRHEGNWKWLVNKKGEKVVLEPIATDRDMAFYNFGDGILNRFTLLFVNKFQSFGPEYENIEGLTKQAEELDRFILSEVTKPYFIKEARIIQARLNDSLISEAFKLYPPAAYSLIGKQHENILKERLKRLPAAAERFYASMRKDKE